MQSYPRITSKNLSREVRLIENRLALATAAGQDWLTVVAAGQVLGVSESSAYALVNNGTLKARKHGSKLRVDPASVAYVLDARRATGPRAIRAEGVPSECADLIQSVNRIHMLRVQVEVELRALEADGRAAEAQGEMDRAASCYELVAPCWAMRGRLIPGGA